MNIFEMVYMRGKIHLQLILLRNFSAQFRAQSGLIPEKHRIAFKFWTQEGGPLAITIITR